MHVHARRESLGDEPIRELVGTIGLNRRQHYHQIRHDLLLYF
jgi:hypothetical protein